MHDLLEGIVPLVVIATIKSLLKIRQHGFKLAELNKMIANFKYGLNEIRDRPSEITVSQLKNGSFRQTSSQTWLLLILLPLMLAKRIRDFQFSKLWLTFKKLLLISQLVFSDSMTDYELLKLRTTIHEFLESIKNLRLSITPKMHNLIHYLHYVTLLGPLKQYWCMRFEGKHSYFKTLVRTSGNF